LGITKSLNIRKKLGKQFNTLPGRHSADSPSGLCAKPTRIVYRPEIVAKYSHYPQLLEVVQQTVLRPPIAQYAQASDILTLPQCCAYKSAPERAMKAAADETRRLLEARG